MPRSCSCLPKAIKDFVPASPLTARVGEREEARLAGPVSHSNSGPCTLHQCRAHSPYQAQCSCRCCQPLRSPRLLTSGTSITGMATASCPAITSRPTTAFQFMARRDQSAALQAMRQDTGIMADGTISAILGFSVDATTAAVSARAGLGRPSGRCGIAASDAAGGPRDRRLVHLCLGQVLPDPIDGDWHNTHLLIVHSFGLLSAMC